jgi:site-specific DNA recombinase
VNTESRPAAVYCRISQDRSGEGLGVERQKEDGRALAASLGWSVVQVYTDNDITAYKDKPRPGYQAMLEAIKSGAIKGVIAWHPSWLHRRTKELIPYIELCKAHSVVTHTVKAGHWDLSNPSGEAVAVTLSAWDQYESATKAERIARAIEQKAKKGGFHGGTRPFGFEKDGVTIRPEEAAELAKAVEQIVTGVSVRAVVRDLNEREVPTVMGKTWTSQQIREAICSPRIAGLSSYKGEIVGPAAWAPIVPRETWEAARHILLDPARRSNAGRGPGVRWLGSGLYCCGICGGNKMRASRTGGKRPSYRCRAGGEMRHVSRDAAALDAFVEAVLIERLSRAGLVHRTLKAADTVDMAALRAESEALLLRREQLAEDFALGKIARSAMLAGTKKITGRSAEIDAIMAAAGWRSPLEVFADKAADIPKIWAGLNLGQKRAVLDYLCTITVLPVGRSGGSGLDPDGVRIDWKTA